MEHLCDENCTRDLDGVCDPRCRERWAGVIEEEQARTRKERREHLHRLMARWAQWGRVNAMARMACGMEVRG